MTDAATSPIFYPPIAWLAQEKISTGYDNGNGTRNALATEAEALRLT